MLRLRPRLPSSCRRHPSVAGTSCRRASSSTYLIAVERESGDDAGLVRVWNNPTRPRLGLIAVLPRHRRRGLARALLARAFDVLAARGESAVSAEVDDGNLASTSLLKAVGAGRVGGSIELVRLHRRVARRD